MRLGLGNHPSLGVWKRGGCVPVHPPVPVPVVLLRTGYPDWLEPRPSRSISGINDDAHLKQRCGLRL